MKAEMHSVGSLVGNAEEDVRSNREELLREVVGVWDCVKDLKTHDEVVVFVGSPGRKVCCNPANSRRKSWDALNVQTRTVNRRSDGL